MVRDEAWLSLLNPKQREAVIHGSAPPLILAGAGSGKTRVITYRIAQFLKLGIDPQSILAVTFTNKAAKEMKERACQLQPKAELAMIRTFHSFCAWYLRHHAKLAGLNPHFSIYDEDDSLQLLKSIQPKLNQNSLRQKARGISLLKDKGILPDDPNLEQDHPWAIPLYADYEKALLESNAVDFGGLILSTLQVLSRYPEVAKRTQQRFTHILVDEFQDTNPLQFKLLQLLSPQGYWLTVVGDDDQSIYSFRGADVNNILEFNQHFPKTHIIRLEQNYRSSGNILAAASSMIAHNQRRMGKTLWTESDAGDRVKVYGFESDEAEAAFAASYALAHPQTQFAILYRTNAQSLLFEKQFNQQKIRYKVVGGLSFFQREEIKDVLAYLTVFVNPKNLVSLKRIINKPSRGIGPATLEKLFDAWGSSADLTQAIARLQGRVSSLNALKNFEQMMRELNQRRADLTLKEFLLLLYEQTGLEAHYKLIDETQATDKLSNLGELLSVAENLEATDADIIRFLEQAALSSTNDDDSEARVLLITLHNAKGLEFDHVLVAGAESGFLPLGHADDDIEEERRLFYVGMTRAKHVLMISFAQERQVWGNYELRSPSPFLGEIDKSCLELHGLGEIATETWRVGQRIFHDDYGYGYIIDFKRRDVQHLLTIKFDNGSIARFIAEYSPLELVEDE